MPDEIEMMAEELHKLYPCTAEGQPIDWGNVARQFPEYAEVYREAARKIAAIRKRKE